MPSANQKTRPVPRVYTEVCKFCNEHTCPRGYAAILRKEGDRYWQGGQKDLSDEAHSEARELENSLIACKRI